MWSKKEEFKLGAEKKKKKDGFNRILNRLSTCIIVSYSI